MGVRMTKIVNAITGSFANVAYCGLATSHKGCNPMSDFYPYDINGSGCTPGWAIVNVPERKRICYYLTEQEARANLVEYPSEFVVAPVWREPDGSWVTDWCSTRR